MSVQFSPHFHGFYDFIWKCPLKIASPKKATSPKWWTVLRLCLYSQSQQHRTEVLLLFGKHKHSFTIESFLLFRCRRCTQVSRYNEFQVFHDAQNEVHFLSYSVGYKTKILSNIETVSFRFSAERRGKFIDWQRQKQRLSVSRFNDRIQLASLASNRKLQSNEKHVFFSFLLFRFGLKIAGMDVQNLHLWLKNYATATDSIGVEWIKCFCSEIHSGNLTKKYS